MPTDSTFYSSFIYSALHDFIILKIITIFRRLTLFRCDLSYSRAQLGMKIYEADPGTPANIQSTILVADDNPENMKLLFETLQEGGYRTLAAVNGERAVEQAKLAQPDLILMDVMMPKMDGFEACRKLKRTSATQHIPVIFMTALSETVDKLRGFEAGGVDYLTKPLQHEEVLARIKAHLSQHRLWQEITSYSQLLLKIGSADSLAEAWTFLSDLPQTSPELAGMAFWEFEPGTDQFALRCQAEFTQGGPTTWQHASGTFSSVPKQHPLFRPVLEEGRQLVIPDRDTWQPYPAWAEKENLRGVLASPVHCHDSFYGVLLAGYHRPIRIGFEEHRHWQSILAQSVGNVIFQSRSRKSIHDLSERLQQENRGLRAEITTETTSEELIGDSPAFRRVLDQLDLVAPTDAAVLILGESGTGKELLAQRVHQQSTCSNGPLIRVNCAAIPKELFESEFFGHTKGAFTGAVQDRVGRFELANKGTLFLDEIGEIPLELQGKLLRVLQEGTFERVGEEKTRTTQVRIVAATNRNLQESVTKGHFREDLYYRLSVFPVTLPPLRERKEDLPALSRHIAAQCARKMGLPVPELRNEQITPLQNYDWPGNIRELQNEIERAMILQKGQPQMLTPPASPTVHPDIPTKSSRIIPEDEWTELQRDNILRALQVSNGRVDGPGGAAEHLRLRPTTLRSRMKAMGIKKTTQESA